MYNKVVALKDNTFIKTIFNIDKEYVLFSLPLIILFALPTTNIFGQNPPITVVNPSFEDKPSDATVPKGWLPCTEGTTPDIMPGFWGQYNEAFHGETYIGLITRDNGTFESIGQRLSTRLQSNECYKFTVRLAQGKVYSGYNNPIKLRIWLGNKLGEKSQLIYQTNFITNEEWEKHTIEFNPTQNFNYIRFEAFYKDGDFSYKGNILMDNLSSILPCGRV